MANNNAKKKNTKSGTKKNTAKANNVKKDVKKSTVTKKIVENKEVKNETVKVKKVEPVIKEVTTEKVVKEKKSFSLTSKQKDLFLVALVVILLVVAFFVTKDSKPKLDIELPVALEGTAGFTEINYSEYEEKINSEKPFVVVIVRDGCGYCEAYEPVLEEVANEYSLPIYYINLANISEEEMETLSTSNSYLKKNQWGTPTTLFMYGDTVIDSISGYVEKDTFVEFAKENFLVTK